MKPDQLDPWIKNHLKSNRSYSNKISCHVGGIVPANIKKKNLSGEEL